MSTDKPSIGDLVEALVVAVNNRIHHTHSYGCMSPQGHFVQNCPYEAAIAKAKAIFGKLFVE